MRDAGDGRISGQGQERAHGGLLQQHGWRLARDDSAPPNNAYNQTPAPLDTALSSFFSTCAQSGGNITGGNGSDLSEVFEGFRHQSNLYVGSGGTYVFKNRFVLKKQAVQTLGASSGEPGAGSIALTNLVNVANGWRWSDRGGDWAEYDDQGRISRYGDKNNNTLWLQRNSAGQISHIIDDGPAGGASGRVVITLHYNLAGFLVQAKDYPQAANGLDLASRSVSYQYDSLGRMTQVSDARGHVTQYGYDSRARITTVTDPLGRVTTMTYENENNAVLQMTAADGGVSNYLSSYDDSKKLFYSKTQGPAAAAGRRSPVAGRRVEDYTHDRAGDLVQYEVNGRTEQSITRDPVARTESRTNAHGFTTTYTKNEFEQITQVQFPGGATSSTQYESAHAGTELHQLQWLGFTGAMDLAGRLQSDRIWRKNDHPQARVHGTFEFLNHQNLRKTAPASLHQLAVLLVLSSLVRLAGTILRKS